MSALQVGPKQGNPQLWAQMCFYACTASVILQTPLIITIQLCVQCECRQDCTDDFSSPAKSYYSIVECVTVVFIGLDVDAIISSS